MSEQLADENQHHLMCEEAREDQVEMYVLELSDKSKTMTERGRPVN